VWQRRRQQAGARKLLQSGDRLRAHFAALLQDDIRSLRLLVRDRACLARRADERRTHRHPIFTDGKLLMWEYPRATPDGDQMDFTEVMELQNGRIRRHRVYWGWFGVRRLMTGSHRR
jgi:hypothetical protein